MDLAKHLTSGTGWDSSEYSHLEGAALIELRLALLLKDVAK